MLGEWNETPGASWGRNLRLSYKANFTELQNVTISKKMHNLQRLLLKSTSARMLAVRKVTLLGEKDCRY
ncbi:reverse transcriptase N-terminal domain-containing protein [Wolbachia endosymbiont of Tribolium confusum]|nr:reverse transcriptase N-terminal domain-containing protein [Wolbachia endosymbiont of Tribolium confusum]